MSKQQLKYSSAIRELSVQFVTLMMQEGMQGRAVHHAVSTFGKHRTKLLGGILGGAGVAGGAWAALTMWSGSMGVWGSLAFSLGLVTTPIWVPFAGGMAGLTAAGGAIYGLVSFSRSRDRRRMLTSVIGFSKVLLNEDEFQPTDERVMRKFLKAKEFKEGQILELLQTSPDEAKRLAADLSQQDRREIARYIFPLVYTGDGVINPVDRRRFAAICAELELEPGDALAISKDYRGRLDSQWAYLRSVAVQLNYFADTLAFDGREMEALRQQVDLLIRFDPRKGAIDRRERLLSSLGGRVAEKSSHFVRDIMGEAAIMSAYALAHTAIQREPDRLRLADIFDGLIDLQTELSPEYKEKLQHTRKRVDRLYRATREQLEAAAPKTSDPS